ncbi:hypothetical protein CDL15_Pgr010315 [Punica granatum]|uniref:Uncharacterized protein n=1 Tax=Punica granatum TaxID=22663 RepID=A0A218W1E8_PUNGR|nr:hypothetical protein CDL15_Pgr010315 [Punica granatum]
MSQQISLFRSQITNRRFDGGTLGILEMLLISKDVRSSIEVRSSLKQFMRTESLCVLREIAHTTLEQKLSVLDFFVKAFALIGDFESCLALRYEALLLRDFKSANHHWLQVNYMEWIKFAEHSLDHGFHSIAEKACTNALASLQKNNTADVKSDESINSREAVRRIEKLKDIAISSTGSSSFQREASGYLKKKAIAKSKRSAEICYEKQRAASSLFRDSIKKRNARKLLERQSLKPTQGLECAQNFEVMSSISGLY